MHRPARDRHLENPDLADELAKARNFDLGLSSPSLAVAMPFIGSGFAEIIGGLAQAAVLAWYAWWAPLLLAAAWGSTHVLLRDSSAWRVFGAEPVVKEQRHARCAYRLAVDAPAAKEIRLFGLAGWAVCLVAARRRRVVDAILREQRLRQGPVRWGLAVIITANAIVFWSLGHDASTGALGLAPFVVFVQAAVAFSTVRAADLIIVLDGARVVETGSHEELIARHGSYAELYGIQARGYR